MVKLMNISKDTKNGIILGIFLGCFLLFMIYDINHEEVPQDKGYSSRSSDSIYLIETLKKFQQIRDPYSNTWSNFYILDRGDSVWINRTIILSDCTAEEARKYYYDYLKENQLFYKYGINGSNNIWFEHNLYNIEGGIAIENTKPVQVHIHVGRYS